MKNLLFLLAVIAVIATGCVRSLNPICEPEDLMIDDRIIGTWTNDDHSIFDSTPEKIEIGRACIPIFTEYDNDGKKKTISSGVRSTVELHNSINNQRIINKIDSLNFYYARERSIEKNNGISDTTFTYYKITLTKLNGLVYFDLIHKEDPSSYNNMTGYDIPAHYIGVGDITKDKLEFKLLDEEKFSNLLKNKQVRLKHQIIKDEGYKDVPAIVLTASTDELRSFIGKYGKEIDMFSKSVIYHRE